MVPGVSTVEGGGVPGSAGAGEGAFSSVLSMIESNSAKSASLRSGGGVASE